LPPARAAAGRHSRRPQCPGPSRACRGGVDRSQAADARLRRL